MWAELDFDLSLETVEHLGAVLVPLVAVARTQGRRMERMELLHCTVVQGQPYAGRPQDPNKSQALAGQRSCAGCRLCSGTEEQAQIVEEALQLREELMGNEYSDMVRAALAARFSDSPEERLAAIESLRDEIEGATGDGSVSVAAAIAKVRARASSRHPA